MRQAELARIWGVSPAYVCRLVRRGMPLASLDEADLWRVENLEKPPRSESGGGRWPSVAPNPLREGALEGLSRKGAGEGGCGKVSR